MGIHTSKTGRLVCTIGSKAWHAWLASDIWPSDTCNVSNQEESETVNLYEYAVKVGYLCYVGNPPYMPMFVKQTISPVLARL
jgi:hypothetical protein